MKPAQHECKRCEKLFCYFKKHPCAPRVYCTPCVEIERLELLAFTRLQRRKAAIARAHQDGMAKHFSRFPNGVAYA